MTGVKEPKRSNPVAKYARRFNTSRKFTDKKNDYRRKEKHVHKSQGHMGA